MLRMKHEKHGFCHAYDANEEKRLRSLGWIADTESSKVAEKEPEIVPPKPEPRRLGRPHKVQ